MFKWTKRIILGTVAAVVVVGGLAWAVTGTHALSYLKSSGKMLHTSFQESIPIEFEIQRARDLLDELVPETRANLKLVAAEQVEVADLEQQIAREESDVATERSKVQRLRETLKQHQATYEFGNLEYSRNEVVEELARRFEHLRTAEKLLEGKKELLRNRKRSLEAATKKLNQTRTARVALESQIESLEAQFRLLQAQSTESEFQLDESKLTQTREIIDNLKKRLDVTRRVLAQESRFVEMIPMGDVQETSVVQRVDSYFDGDAPSIDDAAERDRPVIATH